jgi:hypothetical protein
VVDRSLGRRRDAALAGTASRVLDEFHGSSAQNSYRHKRSPELEINAIEETEFILKSLKNNPCGRAAREAAARRRTDIAVSAGVPT